MSSQKPFPFFAVVLSAAVVLVSFPFPLAAEQVPVHHREGLVHGFLVLRAVDGNGEVLANGELVQEAHGDQVTSELIFHFKDGSLHHETAVFSQRGKFRLISDHLVQKGPSFKRSIDMAIDGKSGHVKIHYSEEDGKEKTIDEKLALPADLANGFTLTLLKNMGDDGATVSMVAATPKPRLVKLVITPQGEDPFTTAGRGRKATHYVVKVELGGITGWLAPLVGKEPPNVNVWMLRGKAPAFVKSEGPLYAGGPIWRIELTSPVWPKEQAAK